MYIYLWELVRLSFYDREGLALFRMEHHLYGVYVLSVVGPAP